MLRPRDGGHEYSFVLREASARDSGFLIHRVPNIREVSKQTPHPKNEKAPPGVFLHQAGPLNLFSEIVYLISDNSSGAVTS